MAQTMRADFREENPQFIGGGMRKAGTWAGDGRWVDAVMGAQWGKSPWGHSQALRWECCLPPASFLSAHGT